MERNDVAFSRRPNEIIKAASMKRCQVSIALFFCLFVAAVARPEYSMLRQHLFQSNDWNRLNRWSASLFYFILLLTLLADATCYAAVNNIGVISCVDSYTETLHGTSVQPQRGAGTSGGTAMFGTGGHPTSRDLVDEERRTDRPQEGDQLHHQQRGPFAHRPGAIGRHGQLHVRRGERGRQEDQRHCPAHRCR